MWELKIKACEPSQHCKYLVVLTEEQKPGALAIRLSETETTHSQAGRACLGASPDRMPVHFFLEEGPPPPRECLQAELRLLSKKHFESISNALPVFDQNPRTGVAGGWAKLV